MTAALQSTTTAADVLPSERQALATSTNGAQPSSSVSTSQKRTLGSSLLPQATSATADEASLSTPSPQQCMEAARKEALAMTIRTHDESDEDLAVSARTMARRLGAGLVKRPIFAGEVDPSEASTTQLLAVGSPLSRRDSFATIDISLNATRRWRSTASGAAGRPLSAAPSAAQTQLPQQPQQNLSSDRRGQRTVTMLPPRPPASTPAGDDSSSVGGGARSTPGTRSQRATPFIPVGSPKGGRRPPGFATLSPCSNPNSSNCSTNTAAPAPLYEREYTEAELDENPALRQLAVIWRKLMHADAIVQEANSQAPPRHVRSDAERQAELLAAERAKLMLFAGRKFNVEQALEEMLEVLAAKEKASEQRRRRRNQQTPLPTDGSVTSLQSQEPGSCDASTAHSPTDVDGGGGVDSFSAADAGAYRRSQPTAAELMRALKQLNAAFLSKHTIAEDELSMNSLRRLLRGINELMGGAREQVSELQVAASRKQQADTRAALSNYKDVMWLIESVDLALITEPDAFQERPSLLAAEEMGNTRMESVPPALQALVHPGKESPSAEAKPPATAGSASLSPLVDPSAAEKPQSGAFSVEAASSSGSCMIAPDALQNAVKRVSHSYLSSTQYPSICEPSVVPFSLFGESGCGGAGEDGHAEAAATAAEAKHATMGLTMLGFMLDAIPETHIADTDAAASRVTSARAKASPSGPPPPSYSHGYPHGGLPGGGLTASAGKGRDESAGSAAAKDSVMTSASGGHGSLPAATAADGGALSDLSLSADAASRDSGEGLSSTDSRGQREGSETYLSDAAAAAGTGRHSRSRTPAGDTGGSDAPAMRCLSIRMDLLTDLKKLYPQFDYDHFIETSRAGRHPSLTQKTEEEYAAEMEDMIRRRQAENASRQTTTPTDDVESLLGNMGKRTSQGGSRLTSAMSRSIFSNGDEGGKPTPGSQGLLRPNSATAQGSVLLSSVMTAVAAAGGGPDYGAKRTSSTTPLPSHAQDGRPPTATAPRDESGETVLLEEKLPCGLRFTIIGKCDLILKETAGADKAAGRSKKGASKKQRRGASPTGDGKAFDRYLVTVKNEHTYSAAVATMRFIKSKLPGLKFAVEAGVESTRPTELKKMLQPGQTQHFLTLVPTSGRQKRLNSASFKDALLFEGELSNGFDTFALLRPGGGAGAGRGGGKGAGGDLDDDLDALSMNSDDAAKFSSIPAVLEPGKPSPSGGGPHDPASGAHQPQPAATHSTTAAAAAAAAPEKRLPPVKANTGKAASPSTTAAAAASSTTAAATTATGKKEAPGPGPGPRPGSKSQKPAVEQFALSPPASEEALQSSPEAQATENNLVALTVLQAAAAAAGEGGGAGAGAGGEEGGGDPMAALLSGVDTAGLPGAAAQMIEHLANSEGLCLQPTGAGGGDGDGDGAAVPGTTSWPLSSQTGGGRRGSDGTTSLPSGLLGARAGAAGRRGSGSSSASGMEDAAGLAFLPAVVVSYSRPGTGRVASASSMPKYTGYTPPPTILIASAQSRPLSVVEASAFSSPGGVQFDGESLRAAATRDGAVPADTEDGSGDGRRHDTVSGPQGPKGLSSRIKRDPKAPVAPASLRQKRDGAAVTEARGKQPYAGVHLAADAAGDEATEGGTTALARRKGAGKPNAPGGEGAGGDEEEEEHPPIVALLADPPPSCYVTFAPGTDHVNVLVPADAAGDEVVHKLFSNESTSASQQQQQQQAKEDAKRRAKEAAMEKEGLTAAQKTACMVSDVMRAVVGKEAKAAMRGMDPAGGSLGKKGMGGAAGGGGGALNGSTPRTEFEVLQEEARALYLEDPLRYDAVIDDLVKLATTQLSGSEAKGGKGAMSGLVQTKALVDIMKAAAEMEAAFAASVTANANAGVSGAGKSGTNFDIADGQRPLSSILRRHQSPISSGGATRGSSREGSAHGASPRALGSAQAFAPGGKGAAQAHGGGGSGGVGRGGGSGSGSGRGGGSGVGAEGRAGKGERDGSPFSPLQRSQIDADGGGYAERVKHVEGADAAGEARQLGIATAEDGAAEVQRILFEQMKAKLLLKLIVEQMKSLWARKEVEGREKARTAMDNTLARTLDLSWEVERNRVMHVRKLIHILDRRTGRVHGWLPFYNDENVLVDASERVDPRKEAAVGEGEQWCTASSTYTNTSGLRAIPTFSASCSPQYSLVSQVGTGCGCGCGVCTRYLHYHEPMRAQANGDVFLSSMQLRRMHHAMCLAKRRRLLPLRLMRPPAEPDRSNGTRYVLFGYRRHVIVLSWLAGNSSEAALNNFAEGVDVRRRLRETLMPLTKPLPTAVVRRWQLAPCDGQAAKPKSVYEERQCTLPSIAQLIRRNKGKAMNEQ